MRYRATSSAGEQNQPIGHDRAIAPASRLPCRNRQSTVPDRALCLEWRYQVWQSMRMASAGECNALIRRLSFIGLEYAFALRPTACRAAAVTAVKAGLVEVETDAGVRG